ncbi:MAG TPA: sulfotransferase [Tepidisphaeraceae bacterium]|nr:sulfotransferase [Tepidisphaeraceae bacterium]
MAVNQQRQTSDADAVEDSTRFGLVEVVLPPPPTMPADGLERVHTPLFDPVFLRAHGIEEAEQGDELFRKARLHEALQRYIEAVRLAPDQPRHHFMVGLCAWQAARPELVERHLKDAVRLQPDHPLAHHVLADWYLERQDVAPALHHSAWALALAPSDPQMIISRACILEGAGQPFAAWELVRGLIEQGYSSSKLADLYGRLAPALGHQREALAMLERLLLTDIAPVERRVFHFSAARLLDGLRHYDEAFAHARMGHEAMPQPYDPHQMEDWFNRSIAYYTPEKLHDLPRASHHSRRPVFIVGMPRSGTSLLEQILASHPRVHGGGELRALSGMAVAATGRDPECKGCFPECLDSISQRMADRMAADYLREIDSIDPTATYVTDKMPLNFLYMGLISILFPESHVIHCTRDPVDTCLSCYMTSFSIGNEFANDLRHLGTFYRSYRRFMEHWTVALNFPMLNVRYEDMVTDLEGQVRRMLEFLDLPWDARCLNFHQTARLVATASRDQVRRPLYASSVGRWRNYRKHLGELRAVLNI